MRFNDEILMDIMYLNGSPVRHIVDAETRFGAARFPSDLSIATILSTLVQVWVTVYARSSSTIRVDQGTAFGEGFTVWEKRLILMLTAPV